jgi:MFS family permease
MNNSQDLSQMWAAQDLLINKNVHMNELALKDIRVNNAQMRMKGFLRFNIFSLVIGIIMSSLVLYFISNHLAETHMVISGIIGLMWSLLICIGAIKHLKMQLTLDYSKPVIDLQHELTDIRLSVLYYFRTSLMVLPFYFSFLLIFVEVLFGIDLYVHGNPMWLMTQSVISLFMGAIAVYIYRQLNINNINKPIVRILMECFGNQALDAIKELKKFEDDVN